MPLYPGKEVPVGRADVTLLHGASVDSDRCHSRRERTIEYREEGALAFHRVVKPAAHFQRDGPAATHRRDYGFHNRQRIHRFAQQVSATAPAQHLLYRATEVDIHKIVAALHEIVCGLGQLLRAASQKLSADWMVVRADCKHTIAQ